MRTWDLSPEAPLSLRVAADARLSDPDFADDQIWELTVGEGEPPSVAIRSTYGLRARSMRLYPNFSWRGEPRTDPSSFAEGPSFEVILPNYLRLHMRPFHDLQVVAEYWVADSHSLLGRFTLLNEGESDGNHHLRLHADLYPEEGGSRMSPQHLSGVSLLSGKTQDLRPVVFLSGGAIAETSAKPALAVRRVLPVGEPQRMFWAHVGQDDPEAGFTRAREFAAVNWEAEVARLERTNDSWIEVETGDPQRDAVFAASQQTALRCLMSSSHLLPQPSFVLSRTPDHGYSARGDGRDYEDTWAGQDVWAAYHLARVLSLVAPEQVKGWLRNYLYVQEASGEIDSKPGLAGQRAGTLCPPLLATLAQEASRSPEDDEFAREVFEPLLEFVQSWFNPRHDRDGDGAPEWDHPLHSGYPESPTFVSWGDWDYGLDIRFSESPDLLAYLLRECEALIEIGQLIGRSDAVAELETRATGLRQALARSWDEEEGTYRHLDRDLHIASKGQKLGGGKGECTVEVEAAYEPMIRLVVRVKGPEAEASKMRVTVHGRGPKGQFSTERIDREEFQWFWKYGTATTEHTFARLNRVEVKGLSDSFQTEVFTADHSRRDLTLLLPLWPGTSDRARAGELIEGALLQPSLHWRQQGLSACAADDPAYAPDDRPFACGVDMVWNDMLGQALLAYDRRKEAADLVLRLLSSASASLTSEGRFREIYDPDRTTGYGARDSAHGLMPIQLFLEVLGVRLMTPWRLELVDSNPYPWPVRVGWRGLTVERPVDGPTSVRFPDGHEVQIEAGDGRIVERVR